MRTDRSWPIAVIPDAPRAQLFALCTSNFLDFLLQFFFGKSPQRALNRRRTGLHSAFPKTGGAVPISIL